MKLSYRNATLALPDLCREVLTYGVDVPSRNGATKELTMLQVELTQPWPLEITAVDRKVSIAAQIAETMWVLSGRNDVEWLSAYLPQAPKFSDDGVTWRGGYGPRLRKWYVGEVPQVSGAYEVDQLKHVVRLLQEDPTTRRAVMAIYDPAVDTEPGKDIPCNNWLHFLPRDGKLHLHVAIRSNDLMWGWSGINSFEWSALLTIVAGMTRLEVGSVTFSISSLHLYERHYAKAERIAGGRGSAPVFGKDNPGFHLPPGQSFDALVTKWFELEALIRDPEADLEELAGEIGAYPEPMLRSWLQVIAGWWRQSTPGALMGTSLGYALSQAPPPVNPVVPATPVATRPDAVSRFVEESDELHRGKDAAYGNSWCKRGEQMSIMANIARKVDRLGVDGGGDTSYDTAQDLMIYLAKYAQWLGAGSTGLSQHGLEHCDRVRATLRAYTATSTFDSLVGTKSSGELETDVKYMFEQLEQAVTSGRIRIHLLRKLGVHAAALAYLMWPGQAAQVPTPAAETEAEFLGNAPVTDVDMWRAGNATRRFNGYADPENS